MAAVARTIARHALVIRPGETVVVDALDECEELIIAVIDAVNAEGGLPYLLHQSLRVRRSWLMAATTEQMELWFDHNLAVRQRADCILMIRGQDNWSELADVPAPTLRYFGNLHIRLGREGRKPGARTTVIRYPSKSLAQQRGMSTDAFANLFFKVSAMDFKTLRAPDTDLSFSIEGLNTNISAGTWNIPDGETAMQIVRESAQGRIKYNVPSSHQGLVFRDIALTFENGRVVAVEADEREKMKAILDTDDAGRYIGEFAIGVNPYLRPHMIDTLFDEKMAGSLHFTPGGTDAEGNTSQVHWDIVQSHLSHYGGGEIYLDGKLWRKDGLFVDKALERLNPDQLQSILDKDDGTAAWS
jgi:aminopeptidase